MGLFKKKKAQQSYDKENKKPVIKASICNGEQVAGFDLVEWVLFDTHTEAVYEAEVDKLYKMG